MHSKQLPLKAPQSIKSLKAEGYDVTNVFQLSVRHTHGNATEETLEALGTSRDEFISKAKEHLSDLKNDPATQEHYQLIFARIQKRSLNR